MRISVSLFNIIRDTNGRFRIELNNDRAAIFNYGIRRIAEQVLEVAKSWTFQGIDDYWRESVQYDKKTHIIKQVVFKNEAPETEHSGGLSTSALWDIMEEGREGWRQGVKKYTYATYPDKDPATKGGFLIATSRNRGNMVSVKRARLGDIYPTKPEYWLNEALNDGIAVFADQLQNANFGEVSGNFVTGSILPTVSFIPNLYGIVSDREDLDVTDDSESIFSYGTYGGEHREDVKYPVDDSKFWYASHY